MKCISSVCLFHFINPTPQHPSYSYIAKHCGKGSKLKKKKIRIGLRRSRALKILILGDFRPATVTHTCDTVHRFGRRCHKPSSFLIETPLSKGVSVRGAQHGQNAAVSAVLHQLHLASCVLGTSAPCFVFYLVHHLPFPLSLTPSAHLAPHQPLCPAVPFLASDRHPVAGG